MIERVCAADQIGTVKDLIAGDDLRATAEAFETIQRAESIQQALSAITSAKATEGEEMPDQDQKSRAGRVLNFARNVVDYSLLDRRLSRLTMPAAAARQYIEVTNKRESSHGR